MMEWILGRKRSDEYLREEDGDLDLDSYLPYRQIIRTTRGENIKDTLAFHIRVTHGRRPLLGVEAKTRNIDEEAGHCSAGT